MLILFILAVGLLIFLGSAVFYLGDEALGDVAVFIFGAPILATVTLIGHGLITWLKNGEWVTFSIADLVGAAGLSDPFLTISTGWVGVDRVSAFIADANLLWLCFAGLWLLAYSAGYWGDRGLAARNTREQP